jgi:hypothetical protein
LTTCVTCPDGTFQSDAGSSACEPCPSDASSGAFCRDEPLSSPVPRFQHLIAYVSCYPFD